MSYYAPPGSLAPPGLGAPPGLSDAQTPLSAGATSGHGFQMPPGINFNAPVIRMGLPPQNDRDAHRASFDDHRRGGDSGQQYRPRPGLGADSGRPQRESLQPPTREEVARTIFVSGLVEGTPDDVALQDILGAGRGLRRWTRVTDADGKPCEFGFVEYEDATSLDIAVKILGDLQLPLKLSQKKEKSVIQEDGGDGDNDQSDSVEYAKISVMVDPETTRYIEQWSRPDGDNYQFRMDTARDELQSLITALVAQRSMSDAVINGDDHLVPTQPDGAEMVTIQASGLEDDLSDIPADKREMIASEIKSFRDRSNRRDVERLKHEQDLEKAERQRAANRIDRLAPSGPSAPANSRNVLNSSVNGVPPGPARAGRGTQMPRDYAEDVKFVPPGSSADDLDSASDSELERRRGSGLNEQLEKRFLEQERRWLQKEKIHFASAERQERDEAAMAASHIERKQDLQKYLDEFDDEAEMRKPTCTYYRNRRLWSRDRRAFRREERRRDDRDRREEDREMGRDRRDDERPRDKGREPEGGYEASLRDDQRDRERPRQSHDMGSSRGHERRHSQSPGPRDRERERDRSRERDNDRASRAGSVLSHGQTAAKPTPSHRDRDPDFGFKLREGNNAPGHDDRNGGSSRPLNGPVQVHSDDEKEGSRVGSRRSAGVKNRPAANARSTADGPEALRARLPTSPQMIFDWKMRWTRLEERTIVNDIRPVIQRKIYEALGVDEDQLVNEVEDVVRARGTADNVLDKLDILEEDAKDVAAMIWREVIFWTEAAETGI